MRDVFRNQYHVWRDIVPLDDDPDPEPDVPRLFNPPRITYYLGRGRHGNNSKLHRAILRERPNPFIEGFGFRGGRSRELGHS
jgi:hypothetical protein